MLDRQTDRQTDRSILTKNHYFAFTLAEVLIVLGIIGVVASLTIPTVIQNVQNQQHITSTKEIFSILSQAYTMSKIENGTTDTWGLTNSADVLTKMKPYLKVTNDCGTGKGCWTSTTKYLNGGTPWDFDSNTSFSKVSLANGMSLAFAYYSSVKDFGDNDLNYVYAYIEVDINGFKAPNTKGKDVFTFYITKNSIVPMGGVSQTSDATFTGYCKNGATLGDGSGCTAWVLSNNNMDYLKPSCNDLAWETKTSCN